MRGKQLDMGAMMAQNAHKRAVGNANMNARGDIIDKAGKVVKAREQIAMEYHDKNPQQVKTVGLKALAGELLTPEAAVAQQRQKMREAEAAKAAGTPEPQQAPKRQRKLLDDQDGGLI